MHPGDSGPPSKAPHSLEPKWGGVRGALGVQSLEDEAEPRVTPLQSAPPSAPKREKPFLVTHSRAVSSALFFGLRAA